MKIPSLQILVESLVEKGFILETKPLSSSRAGHNTIVEVGNTGPLDGDIAHAENSISHYLESLRQGRLSWLLFDGAIVQLKYAIRGDVIRHHRYCYIPAPFSADLRSNLGQDILELIEGASASDPLGTPRKTPLRFEYDPLAQTDHHAASHLHLNTSSCRLPMRGPLNVREFVGFIVRNFYASDFPADICGALLFESDATITEHEEAGFHLGWRRPIAKELLRSKSK